MKTLQIIEFMGTKQPVYNVFFEKTVVTPENSGRDGFIQKDDF